ncbi:M24 family metallopeptidase [Pseudooceanicola sp.]|uniref:M24 family metallopeptidase n=1 Tax=Pseudooceanicola sp. TaxID=1914328 RepID=UPI0035C70A48
MTHAPLFPTDEFRARVARAQSAMHTAGLDALLLTTAPEIFYFTGFLTRFWESPTRPWFLVLPAHGDPVAVIPSIGAHLMARGWITDIRTWRSPDYADDGVSLLAGVLRDLVPSGGRIGLPSGGETHLRMPLSDWQTLQDQLPDRVFGPDAGIMRRLRMVKSEAEIALIRRACEIAYRAFDRVPEIAAEGTPLSTVFRRFQILCLEEGADWVPYLAGGAAPGGYGDVISPADDRPLAAGDVMMLDTGLVRDGYFCDFDRNWSIGPPSPEVAEAHARLIEATWAGFNCARVGATAAEVFHAMDRIVSGGTGGGDAGRLGHGLGMQLTEPPSLIPADDTVLEPGMVLTLEPGIDLGDGRIMVHEENIVLREGGAEWLSAPQGPEIRVIG